MALHTTLGKPLSHHSSSSIPHVHGRHRRGHGEKPWPQALVGGDQRTPEPRPVGKFDSARGSRCSLQLGVPETGCRVHRHLGGSAPTPHGRDWLTEVESQRQPSCPERGVGRRACPGSGIRVPMRRDVRRAQRHHRSRDQLSRLVILDASRGSRTLALEVTREFPDSLQLADGETIPLDQLVHVFGTYDGKLGAFDLRRPDGEIGDGSLDRLWAMLCAVASSLADEDDAVTSMLFSADHQANEVSNGDGPSIKAEGKRKATEKSAFKTKRQRRTLSLTASSLLANTSGGVDDSYVDGWVADQSGGHVVRSRTLYPGRRSPDDSCATSDGSLVDPELLVDMVTALRVSVVPVLSSLMDKMVSDASGSARRASTPSEAECA